MRNAKRLALIGVSVLAIAAAGVGTLVVHQSNVRAASSGTGTLTHLAYGGSATLSGITAGTGNSTGLSPDAVSPDSGDNAQFPRSGNGAIRVPAAQVPQPAPSAVSGDNSSVVTGFAGLNHFDERTSGTGAYTNTNFSLEPPDQGLCVGGGYVFEQVNDALRVFDTAGNPLTAAISLNQFYGLAPGINRSTGVRGAFVSDPKCYYDAPTHSWFVTVLVTGQDAHGNLIAPTFTDIAVTTSANPASATWQTYKLYGTDDGTNGTPSHPGCPCFGDQPLIGADATGFYVSTNEFTLVGNGFNGAQVYAMSKTGLESGTNTTAVHIDAGETIATPDAGGVWYSLQPATTPGAGYAADTEYFLSSLQFFSNAPLDNRIAVWALTGTSSLNSATPSVSLTHEVISSEVYGQPPDSAQKNGSTPLAAVIASIYAPKTGSNPAQPLEFLNGNDDRMNQVVYANGHLYAGVNTAIASNGPSRVGIAYFIVSPSVSNGQVSGTMANQGYVSLQQNDVLFPSIGVNAAGKGVITFTVAGPDFYPSAGYALIDASSGAGAVHIAGAGVGPEDGFTGYYPFGTVTAYTGRVSRWGDYSAAVADASGNVWMAAEYIGQTCTLAQFEQDTTCGGTRTILANWGTYVTEVQP